MGSSPIIETMRKDLEQKLIEDFPSLFRDMYGDPMKTSMAFGVETRDGWYDLIHELCTKLKDIVNDEFHFLQIKEKFGILRVYCSLGNNDVKNLIAEYETKSEKICDFCGQPGIMRDNGWKKTRCDECVDKR